MNKKDHGYKIFKEKPLERTTEERRMTERVILLEEIDPVVMLGPNNRLLDQIQGYFPKDQAHSQGK
jgi:hypothetical protein